MNEIKILFLKDLKNIIKERIENIINYNNFSKPKTFEKEIIMLNTKDLFSKYCIFCNSLINSSFKKQVFLSKELLTNPLYRKYCDKIQLIKTKLEKCENVNHFLSQNIENIFIKFNKTDKLLLEWSIYHLHFDEFLSGIKNNNRSKELLFIYIDHNNVYFLDILEHDFVNKRLLEIIDNNWPEIFNKNFAIENYTGTDFSPEEIKNFRKYNIIYLDKINNKTIYPQYFYNINYYDAIYANLITSFKGLKESIINNSDYFLQKIKCNNCHISLDIYNNGIIIYEKNNIKTLNILNDKNLLQDILKIKKYLSLCGLIY